MTAKAKIATTTESQEVADLPESVVASMEDEIKAIVEQLRQKIADAGASRPLACAQTKIEEAAMWVDKHFAIVG